MDSVAGHITVTDTLWQLLRPYARWLRFGLLLKLGDERRAVTGNGERIR
jgi:hypothetical protein